MFLNRVYYQVKPLVPRALQIFLRGAVARSKRHFYKPVWPIDERAGKKPEGWTGWPGQKRFAFILMHDVDTTEGHGKCDQLMQIDEKMGVRSLFSFVPEAYRVSPERRQDLVKRGFEVGVHGLKHDGKLFQSRVTFAQRAIRINEYLKEWNSVGFVSPSMHRNLDWMHELNIEYDASTFDTDPFEPEPRGVETIFPFIVRGSNGQRGYVELPYTLPQDFTLFVLMKEDNTEIWKRKLEWIVEHGGMALLITHPDYMNYGAGNGERGQYPAELYAEFLEHVKSKYANQYWNPLPRELARFWKNR